MDEKRCYGEVLIPSKEGDRASPFAFRRGSAQKVKRHGCLGAKESPTVEDWAGHAVMVLGLRQIA